MRFAIDAPFSSKAAEDSIGEGMMREEIGEGFSGGCEDFEELCAGVARFVLVIDAIEVTDHLFHAIFVVIGEEFIDKMSCELKTFVAEVIAVGRFF